MKPYKRAIATSAFVISLTLGTASIAADLPKEGTFKGTFSSYGTNKTIKVGDLSLTTFDETGPQLADGFADHLTLHCWGIGEVANGITANHGYCVGTDPSGDQIASKFAGEKAAQDKAMKGTTTFTSGTGKFAGVSGTLHYVVHAPEFRAPSEGTYVNYVTFEGNYKVP
ncbi:MAG: hypothetical protein ABSC06_28800 [Rhodopila sp.]|jgi:hypothetical protein